MKNLHGTMQTRLIPVIILLFLFSCIRLNAHQHDSLNTDTATIRKGRLAGVLTVQGALYIGTFTGLYFAWYNDYPQSSFHFFNDDNEWMQMDKCGHTITAYYISRVGYSAYRWSGVKEKKAAWYGGLFGFAYMLNIEILDGFSSEWGFSPGDLTANTLGSMMFVAQQLAWHEQRFTLKYSFHQTQYARYRPDLLGDNLIQNMIKDYNGHSYWISGNISSFLPERIKFPKWLNIAAGYGAEGMTGAFNSSPDKNGNPLPPFPRCRKFFLSLDIDLTRIPTKSKALKLIFNVLSFIKIPAPTLEYNTLGQFKAYLLYY
ncbi:MAG: DUF2279 domain-containing protein [Bacteroidetes bacterium]|nr:DUF2279 domain-containing protein [Bacteroidota bacterium]